MIINNNYYKESKYTLWWNVTQKHHATLLTTFEGLEQKRQKCVREFSTILMNVTSFIKSLYKNKLISSSFFLLDWSWIFYGIYTLSGKKKKTNKHGINWTIRQNPKQHKSCHFKMLQSLSNTSLIVFPKEIHSNNDNDVVRKDDDF